MTPRIGIIPGDPSGIGPELVARLLNSDGVAEAADILLIGDRVIFEQGMAQADMPFALRPVEPSSGWAATKGEGFPWVETHTINADDIRIAGETVTSGQSVLETLNRALDLLKEGVIEALVFAPFNKAAMHLAGLQHPDELHHIGERLGVTDYLSELNTLDGMWTSRVTSHIALKDVADTITEQRLDDAIELADKTLRRSGIKRPRIAVAALNPHAGDGGNFGTEEIDLLQPVVEKHAAKQMAISGPWPSDTVFLKVAAKEIDAVVTMYHDQGQIALKLMGFSRGVTVQGGIPYPITTPAHGTAFDIAGQGKADVGATRAAFDIACDMVRNWT
ncbi:4-hydroxythreonine-4-phosphate dehydrogenase PdxA [Qingshengfaniella alkalisoli]|uniref:4-hydroxythreonine-4-phosphate dehydrogenase PdxA n=1 Tax=Qingshengfaniella alkalisoli TaxID=2599296 RepID=A0A5B8IZT4_9RHOB|nr:4-hydroxythreonine-4-phosphate dehydrogenase PdxA [Qingshengfaniella alkalisoli]QDY71174.1 4-hydroxythreonine-4-phosphate dehydrogenase PdxA [Qingshengfaniella alkalisoli]